MSPEELLSYFLSLGFAREMAVLFISALPVVELRLAIPVAIIGLEMPWYNALILAIIGNMLPVPLILLFFNTIYRLLGKIGFFSRMLKWLVERTRRRGGIIERYERIGLILFVAIPLPVTGAWTGSLIAAILSLKFWPSLLSIFIGVLTAGIIVTCLSLLSWVGALIAGIGLSVLAVSGLWKASKHG